MRLKKDEIKVVIGLLGCVLFVGGILGMDYWQQAQFKKVAWHLKTLSLQTIHELRVYRHRPWLATGTTFSSTEPITKAFLEAVKDIQPYNGSPKGVGSVDHEWFLEVELTSGEIIQMPCHLPANKEEVVHGSFGKFYEKGGGPFYGNFQSHLLFQWYWNYSLLWLGKRHEGPIKVYIGTPPRDDE